VRQPVHGDERDRGGVEAHHSLITNEDVRKRWRDLLTVVKEEYEDIVKNEVQRAISADEESIGRLAELHRQRQGVHAEGARSRTSTPGATKSPTID
jgi:serine protein kinase